MTDFFRQHPRPRVGAQHRIQIVGHAVGAVAGIGVQGLAHHPGNIEEADAAVQEGLHRDLVGGIEHGGRQAAGAHGIDGKVSAGKRSCAGAWNTSWPSLARSSRRDGEAMRRGQASAWAMGVRMSGAERCAMVVPSS